MQTPPKQDLSHVSPLINSTGGVAGQRLSQHPDIRKLGFTGSTSVGKQIMSRYWFTQAGFYQGFNRVFQNKENQGSDRAQLVECLPGKHNALGLIPKAAESRCGGPPCNVSTLEVEAGDQMANVMSFLATKQVGRLLGVPETLSKKLTKPELEKPNQMEKLTLSLMNTEIDKCKTKLHS